MMKSEESLLRQEVLELTSMLKDEEGFADVRRLLGEHGLDRATVLLAGFLEDEEGWEGGVIVTPQRDVYVYERNSDTNDVERWEQIADPSSLLDTYPAVLTALEMTG